MSGLAGSLSLLKRLRGRPDSEHEMSLNRVALGTGILLYALAIGAPRLNVAVLIAYALIALVVLLHIASDDRIRPVRRIGVILLDVAALGHLMHANGAAGSAFVPLYLWLILGNGFRFGVKYLWTAVAASVASFSVVCLTTPFWRDLPVLSIGLTIGLVALPGYAGTLIRKLSAARAAAEEASRAKSYFLASVSHELRTPLTAIIGLGAHLADAEGEAEDRAMAGTIVSAGRQLLGMINRLLDYSRFEAKGGIAEMRSFDLAALLVAVRELMRYQAQEKGLKLNLHVAADTPIALKGDEAHLRDILVNLVGNALKFTATGAITIVAGVEPDARGGHRLRLAVADTGIGIAEAAQAHIFGSFRQADDTIIDHYGGTGLGLAICKQLVDLMGGEIGVDSRPGAGSRFWLTARVELDDVPPRVMTEPRLLLYSADPLLARAIGRGVVRRETREAIRALYDPAVPSTVLIDTRLAAEQGYRSSDYVDFADTVARGAVPILVGDADDPLPPRAVIERCSALLIGRNSAPERLDHALAVAGALTGLIPAAPPAPAAVDHAPRRILVADDNAMNQKVFGMILGRVGHQVVCASDGEQALDLMKDHGFDVVLMDVNMPVLNGIEATKLYRFAALGQKRIPIVAVTADASPATAERCLDAGMDACIAKPIDAEPLLALIDALTAPAAVPAPMVPAFDPTGVVTPLFRDSAADPDPAIDWHSLDELEELGGRDFVRDLLTVYTDDADTLLAAVTAAIAAGDVEAFRLNAHALRSSAANVGARRVAELCLHYQRIGESEFQDRGTRYRDRLAAELVEVATTLGGWADRPQRAAG